MRHVGQARREPRLGVGLGSVGAGGGDAGEAEAQPGRKRRVGQGGDLRRRVGRAGGGLHRSLHRRGHRGGVRAEQPTAKLGRQVERDATHGAKRR